MVREHLISTGAEPTHDMALRAKGSGRLRPRPRAPAGKKWQKRSAVSAAGHAHPPHSAYLSPGPLYSVHGWARAQARCGEEVHVFATNIDGPSESSVPLGEPVELDGVSVWYFPCRAGRRLYRSPGMGRSLDDRIRDFDIPHLHISCKKGLDRLIPAMVHVPHADLVIAGNDEEGLRPRLEQIARGAGVAERVRFTGPLYGEQKWAMLHKADILALASYSENFGMVVLEAMTCAVRARHHLGCDCRPDAGSLSSS